MADDYEDIAREMMDQYFDHDLKKLICDHLAGKSVVVGYITLCYIIGMCIAQSSKDLDEARKTLDMCGNFTASIIRSGHKAGLVGAEDDEPTNTPVSKLQ